MKAVNFLATQMDKKYFKKQSLKEASDHQQYYKSLSDEEKEDIFRRMLKAAYGLVGKDLPRMEKKFMGARKMWNDKHIFTGFYRFYCSSQ